jgi:hypothetical protein
MPWENKPAGPASWVQRVEGALRHPDGSPDIAAYGRIAHRERDAAVVAAVQDTARSLRAMASAISRALRWSLGRSGRIRSNAPLRG